MGHAEFLSSGAHELPVLVFDKRKGSAGDQPRQRMADRETRDDHEQRCDQHCHDDRDTGRWSIVAPPKNPERRAAARWPRLRSEEHTSEIQSLMRISYAVFCLKKKQTATHQDNRITTNI